MRPTNLGVDNPQVRDLAFHPRTVSENLFAVRYNQYDCGIVVAYITGCKWRVGCGPSFPFKWSMLAADIAYSFLYSGHISGSDTFTIPSVTNSLRDQICRSLPIWESRGCTIDAINCKNGRVLFLCQTCAPPDFQQLLINVPQKRNFRLENCFL